MGGCNSRPEQGIDAETRSNMDTWQRLLEKDYITIDTSNLEEPVNLEELQKKIEEKLRECQQPQSLKTVIAGFIAGIIGGGAALLAFHLGHLLAQAGAAGTAVAASAVLLNPVCLATCAGVAIVVGGLTIGWMMWEKHQKKKSLTQLLDLVRQQYALTSKKLAELQQNNAEMSRQITALQQNVQDLQQKYAQLEKSKQAQEVEYELQMQELIKSYERKLRQEQDGLMMQFIQEALSDDQEDKNKLTAVLARQAEERKRAGEQEQKEMEQRHKNELCRLKEELRHKLHQSLQAKQTQLLKLIEERYQEDMAQLKQEQVQLTQQLLEEKEENLKKEYEHNKKEAKMNQLQVLLGQYQRELRKVRFDAELQAEAFQDKLNEAVQAALKEQSDSMLDRMRQMEQNALHRQEQAVEKAVLEAMCWSEQNALKREGNRVRDMERQLECPVCQDNVHDTVLQCGHVLCQPCVASLLACAKSCPMCSKDIVIATRKYM